MKRAERQNRNLFHAAKRAARWALLCAPVEPLHTRSHPLPPGSPPAQHPAWTPPVSPLLKTLPGPLQMMDCPLPAELGERSPGSREQLSGKCIFSMGVDSRAAALPALGGATAVLADVLQCHQPQTEVRARDPHLHHPPSWETGRM